MVLQRYFSGIASVHRTGHRPKPSELPAGLSKGSVTLRDGVAIHFDSAESLYPQWPTPVCIMVDGPYGIGGFPGDPPTPEGLPEVYAPHIAAWSQCSTPETTLWFWN